MSRLLADEGFSDEGEFERATELVKKASLKTAQEERQRRDRHRDQRRDRDRNMQTQYQYRQLGRSTNDDNLQMEQSNHTSTDRGQTLNGTATSQPSLTPKPCQVATSRPWNDTSPYNLHPPSIISDDDDNDGDDDDDDDDDDDALQHVSGPVSPSTFNTHGMLLSSDNEGVSDIDMTLTSSDISNDSQSPSLLPPSHSTEIRFPPYPSLSNTSTDKVMSELSLPHSLSDLSTTVAITTATTTAATAAMSQIGMEDLMSDYVLAKSFAESNCLSRTRSRRARLPELVHEVDYCDEQFQIFVFWFGQDGSGTKKSLPMPMLMPMAIQPSQQTIDSILHLLKSAFTNLTNHNIHGYVGVILYDMSHDDDDHHRRCRQKSSGRHGNAATNHGDGDHDNDDETQPIPFDTVACVCLFDILSDTILGDRHHIFKINYFVTDEQFSGRGLARLLIDHIKLLASHISYQTQRESILIVLSLEHTIPFWARMGLWKGGRKAKALESYNMANTTVCTEEIILGSKSESRHFDSRCRSLDAVRHRLSLPIDSAELKAFPRFQTRVTDAMQLAKVHSQTCSTSDLFNSPTQRNLISSTGRRTSIGQPRRKNRSTQIDRHSRRDSHRVSQTSSTHPPVSTPQLLPPTLLPVIPLPSTVHLDSASASLARIPVLTSACEWKSFWRIIHLLQNRSGVNGFTLPGCPPYQHIHTKLTDFAKGEELIGSVRFGDSIIPPGLIDRFRLTKMKLIEPIQPIEWKVEIQLHGQILPNHTYHHIDRSTSITKPSIAIAIIPIYFLYKPSHALCPLHQSAQCCRFVEEAE